MGIDNQSRLLQTGEVISLKNTNDYIIPHNTFKTDEFISALRQSFGRHTPQWFMGGVECEVLTPGAGWQKGRVRICLEFCPEESITDESLAHILETGSEHDQDNDSPLDEIRLRIQENV